MHYAAQSGGIAGNDARILFVESVGVVYLGGEGQAGQVMLLTALEDGLYPGPVVCLLVLSADSFWCAIYYDINPGQQILKRADYWDTSFLHQEAVLRV